MFARRTIVLIFLGAASIVGVPSKASAQCDDAEAQPIGDLDCPATCSGTNPYQPIVCRRNGQVRATVSCQDTNWNGGRAGNWFGFNTAIAGECEAAPKDNKPICLPDVVGPNKIGIENGKWMFKYFSREGHTNTPTPIGCHLDAFTFTQEHNTLIPLVLLCQIGELPSQFVSDHF
jgi:hypothetical protein